MIGKVTVRTPNPPCSYCGGMGSYHGDDLCPGWKPVPKDLDAITDVVLRYKPPEKVKATKAREKRRRKRDAKKG